MNLFLTIMLSVLVISGLSSSAYAIHAEIPSETQSVVAAGNTQVTLSGEVRVRGWYLQNYSNNTRSGAGTPQDTHSQTWYDQRIRLGLKAEVTRNTMAYIMLESAPDDAGPNYTLDVFKWGAMNAKPGAELVFLEAWLQHKGSGLFGIPAGVKAGHMPLALGEKQFLDHTKFGDDAVLFFADPTKKIHLGAWAAKFKEGSTTASNARDKDAYALYAVYRPNNENTLGANYTYISDKTNTGGQSGSLQNLGLHANGQMSGFSYKAEIDLQFGDVLSSTTANTYNGYGILFGLGYRLNPVNIRGEFALGSGDNTQDGKNSELVVVSGNDVHYTLVYEYTTRTAASSSNQIYSTSGRASGIANTTYYRLGVDYSPVKNLTASLDGFILRATKVMAGSNDIGNEVDVKLTYKLDKNLTYSVGAGYLAPGQWWIDSTDVTAANKKAITQAVHALTFGF